MLIFKLSKVAESFLLFSLRNHVVVSALNIADFRITFLASFYTPSLLFLFTLWLNMFPIIHIVEKIYQMVSKCWWSVQSVAFFFLSRKSSVRDLDIKYYAQFLLIFFYIFQHSWKAFMDSVYLFVWPSSSSAVLTVQTLENNTRT